MGRMGRVGNGRMEDRLWNHCASDQSRRTGIIVLGLEVESPSRGKMGCRKGDSEEENVYRKARHDMT